MQLHTLGAGRLGSSVITPDPGVQNLSTYERGVRGGKARDPAGPQKVNTIAPLATLVTPYRGAPATWEPGEESRRRHPVLGLGILRRWGGGEWDQWNRGQHGEMTPVASTPRGEQTRVSNVRGNTWRLPPQPWDAAQFVGMRQAGSES